MTALPPKSSPERAGRAPRYASPDPPRVPAPALDPTPEPEPGYFAAALDRPGPQPHNRIAGSFGAQLAAARVPRPVVARVEVVDAAALSRLRSRGHASPVGTLRGAVTKVLRALVDGRGGA